jgi:hypothetical protein
MEAERWFKVSETLREGDIIEITLEKQEDIAIPRKIVGYCSKERSVGVHLGYTSGVYELSDIERIADTSDVKQIHFALLEDVRKVS